MFRGGGGVEHVRSAERMWHGHGGRATGRAYLPGVVIAAQALHGPNDLHGVVAIRLRSHAIRGVRLQQDIGQWNTPHPLKWEWHGTSLSGRHALRQTRGDLEKSADRSRQAGEGVPGLLLSRGGGEGFLDPKLGVPKMA